MSGRINDGRSIGTSATQQTQATRTARSIRQTSDDVRFRFINHLLSSPGKSIASAALAFGIPRSTAYDIKRRYDSTGQMTRAAKGGAINTKISSSALQALLDWVDNEADVTLRSLSSKILAQFGITLSMSTISRVLTKNGFTLKLLRTIPECRNSPDVIAARRCYANELMSNPPIDRRCIIWVDETGFNLHLRRKYGRAPSGLRANVVVANSRGRNISICAAMSEEGFLFHNVHNGAYTAMLFVEFLEGLFEKLSLMGRRNCLIILDNVRFHHSAIVADCATRFSHTLFFLPAYSPMLNPIESLFGKWKTSIRTRHVVFTAAELLSAIESGRQEISVTDCLGWIRDANRNVALSLQNHMFD